MFQHLAARGRTSVDWFYGFKLHLVVNDPGKLLNLPLTLGNADERKSVPELLQTVFGRVFADCGYVSAPLTQKLRTCGIEFLAKPKRNMKPRLMQFTDKLLAPKRAMIESIIDPLKNIRKLSIPAIGVRSTSASTIHGIQLEKVGEWNLFKFSEPLQLRMESFLEKKRAD